ncbi:MAG: SDR family NAD(P)-dependent oxidoreductase [Alphaproteobacteria bacterium]|nr:SDR family NAD(P)-dependent oxidoreductase [Alphaproteobacteria bacterium]
MSEGTLSGKVALVTGASRGIGKAVALRYAAEGAHVVALARTVGALEELDDTITAAGGNVTLVPCDLKDFDAIDTLGPVLLERFDRLDVFVGNAGLLGEMTPLTHYEPKSWHEVFDVNVHANWRLIRTLEPVLRRSEAGRAILVTSGAARNPRAYWGAYAVTKAAVEALAQVWASELANTDVRVNLLNPGATRTGMRAAAFPGEDPMSLKTPDDITDAFVELASTACTRHGEFIDLA